MHVEEPSRLLLGSLVPVEPILGVDCVFAEGFPDPAIRAVALTGAGKKEREAWVSMSSQVSNVSNTRQSELTSSCGRRPPLCTDPRTIITDTVSQKKAT